MYRHTTLHTAPCLKQKTLPKSYEVRFQYLEVLSIELWVHKNLENRTLKTEQRNARQTREKGTFMATVLKSHKCFKENRVITNFQKSEKNLNKSQKRIAYEKTVKAYVTRRKLNER